MFKTKVVLSIDSDYKKLLFVSKSFYNESLAQKHLSIAEAIKATFLRLTMRQTFDKESYFYLTHNVSKSA